MSLITIRVPAPLRRFTDGKAEIETSGSTVDEALRAVASDYPGLAERILDGDGALRQFVNLYLGETNIRSLQGAETPVPEGSTLHIVPAVAGGRS